MLQVSACYRHRIRGAGLYLEYSPHARPFRGGYLRELPYFRWFAKDAETDETYRAMTDEEVGFYHRCLNLAWINDGIPADPAARARVLGRNRNQADARWTTLVASRFVPHEHKPGYLVNTRQETERVQAKHKSVKATESAKVRYERTATDDANALHARAHPESVSESDSEDCSKELSLHDDFNRYTEACELAQMQGSESDLFMARTWWVRLDMSEKLAAVAGIKDRVAAGEYAEARYCPLPQNYLQQKLWQRTIRTRLEPAQEKLHAKRNEVLQMAKMFGRMGNQK